MLLFIIKLRIWLKICLCYTAESSIQIWSTHFPKAFFEISHFLMDLILIYYTYKYIIAKLVTAEISDAEQKNSFVKNILTTWPTILRMFKIKAVILNKVYILLYTVVGIVTGYGLDDRGVGVWVPVKSRIFSSPHCPDRLWGPPNLSNGYRGLFRRG
jgi:hypothetical protein